MVKPIPDGYPQVIPYLSVDGASAAIDFYTRVFGARERMRMPAPNGKLGHAEPEIGNSLGPRRHPGHRDDLHGDRRRGVRTGDRRRRDRRARGPEPVLQYGDRAGQFVDPFGHKWFVATHVEDVSPEDMEQRAAAAMGG